MAYYLNINADIGDICNVNDSVGSREIGTRKIASNRRTDMMLVYYCLYYCRKDGPNSYLTKNSKYYFRDNPPIGRQYSDPFFGDFLANAIMEFQKEIRSKGNPVFPDGRVDSFHSGLSSITRTKYTILALQEVMSNHSPSFMILINQNRNTPSSANLIGDIGNAMKSDPLMPSELKHELFQNNRFQPTF